jgi:hypothetical protein
MADTRAEISRRWRERNPDKHAASKRAYQLRSQYGITPEEYDEMLAAQGGKCALCETLPLTKRLAVDHDHATGQVRGLLCWSCNGAIGLLQDDPALIRKVAVYVERNRVESRS